MNNIWEKYKEILIIGAVYYALPMFLIRDTSSAMLALLMVTPLAVWVLSIKYGEKWGVKWAFTLAVVLLWLPTIPLFFNESALAYALFYGGLSLLGQWTGKILAKNRR